MDLKILREKRHRCLEKCDRVSRRSSSRLDDHPLSNTLFENQVHQKQRNEQTRTRPVVS